MRKSKIRYALLPAACGLASLGAGAVQAQDTSSGPAITLEEVVVTARKVQESSQAIPITVAAFTAKDIENKVVLNARDLGQTVTGLVATANSQGGAPTFAIRATKTDNGVDGGVAAYFDDVPLISTVGMLNSFYDIASVEILKGPQGTQFGTNTTGGTITVRAAKPTEKFEGYVEAGGSNFSGKEATGVINLPVNDMLQFRLAGNWAKRDGFIENRGDEVRSGATTDEFSTDNHYSGRLSVRIKTDSVTNDIVGDYYHEDDIPRQAIPVVLNALGAGDFGNAAHWGERTGTSDTVYIGGDPSGNTRTYWNRHKLWGVQDVLNWEVNNNVSIKNVLGVRNDIDDTSENNGGTSLSVINVWTKHDNREYVDDLTFRFKTDDNRFRTNAGVYYSRSTRRQQVAANAIENLFLDGYGEFILGNPAWPPGTAITSNIHTDQYQWSYSRALYFNADYDLTDKLTISLGGRYNWDSGKYKFSSSQGLGTPDLATVSYPTAAIPCNAAALAGYSNPDLASCLAFRDGVWKEPSFNFVVTDKFAENSLIYAKVSSSFLAGGFNGTLREIPTFNPEKTIVFEDGIKSDWSIAGQPIRTNFDVFYGSSKDKQEVENANYAGGGSGIGVANAGSLTFYGSDLEIKYLVLDSLEISADWTHLKASYDNFTFPAVGTGSGATPATDLTGATPAQVPEDTANLALTYTWPLSSTLGTVSSTLSGFYSSEVKYHDVTNDGGIGSDYGPAYWLANFSASWKDIMGLGLDVTAWVRNLTDKTYVVYASPQNTVFGYSTFQYGDPRTFGLRVRYNF